MLRQDRYETIAIAKDGGIATLTLNRPERLNAVNDTMHSELSTIFADAQDDPEVNVVVLTGAGRAFSAGGDTSLDRKFETKTGRGIMQEARHIIDDVIDLEKPLIAAVNGHAIGLGATLATLADVSFMAKGAKLGDPHVKVNLPAGNGSAVIWPLLIGVNRAKQLLMAGDIISAEQAVELGLISQVVDDGAAAVAAAMELAGRLNSTAPHAVQGTKVAINRLLRMSSDAILPLSLALEDQAMQHPAYRQAMEALAAAGR
ncbi:MAG: enoyl-CoA hydratase/isomerase family protein [Dehalococcoidia bacterium]|nr:enoyl-CoA hydratase/isomerase family protein [Dehalococcoidia bacterium]